MATSKYKNKKTLCGGIEFASKAEAKRYEYLSMLQIAGLISNLEHQVRFGLITKQVWSTFIDDEVPLVVKERACYYVADFQYLRGGRMVVEDVKGMKKSPAEYIIKRKLMLERHGIVIREVRP